MFRVRNLILSARIFVRVLTAAASDTMYANSSSQTTWTPDMETAISALAIVLTSLGVFVEWKKLRIMEHHFVSR